LLLPDSAAYQAAKKLNPKIALPAQLK